jgi:uncharacterized small protein (DUF1192 family)
MADRAEGLRRTDRARHEATMARARQALEFLRRQPQPVSFRHLARAAGISRSWLYRQPELRQEIERLRKSLPTTRTSAQSSQRASTDSLRQQLHIYRDEIARLRAENAAIKDQLARQLGTARAASVTRTS